MLPGASVRPRTQRLRGLGVGRDVLNVERLLGSSWDSTLYGKGRGGSMRGKGVRGRGSPRTSPCSTCPSTDELDTRTPWLPIRKGVEAFGRAGCVSEADGDRDSAVYFPGFGTISSRETFADTRLTLCLLRISADLFQL